MIFISKRQTLYNEFKQELSTILTPVLFAEYEARAEAAMIERSMYNKRMEALWRKEREVLKQKRN